MASIDYITDFIRFSIDTDSQSWVLTDLRSHAQWRKSGGSPWLWDIQRNDNQALGSPFVLHDIIKEKDALHQIFHYPSSADCKMDVIFRFQEDSLFLYLNPLENAPMPEVELAPDMIQSTAQEGGGVVIPCRMGLYVRAEGTIPFTRRFGTYDYEGCHMAMAGLLKRDGGLLATWSDPYIALQVSRGISAKEKKVQLGFNLSDTARSIRIQSLPIGDFSSLSTTYLQTAKSKGYAVTFEEKKRVTPQVERLFGACNFKLWTALDRRVDENLQEKSVTVHWTFDEAAKIAEHLKNDLRMEDVLFHLGGWTRYGYDCRHPDIMPPNPECGGERGLQDCAERVQKLGYLFCLHDNYQDMYRDAPSWDECAIQKKPDGSMTIGGVWLGGRAYITCSEEAMKLASRPENLQAVRDAIHPDLYFIDTTYAAGPQECFDPRHPLTKRDDIHWKKELSEYARDTFGMFGSECGREWAIPCADFFEGLVSVGGKYYHQLNPDDMEAVVLPFFDMVYRDCIALHGKYGYSPSEMAEQVIHHITCGRPMYYHRISDHIYWETDSKEELPIPKDEPDRAIYTRAHGGWAEGMCVLDRFMKNTHEILGPMHKLTAATNITRYEFLDASLKVRSSHFGDGMQATVNGGSHPYTVHSEFGGDVILPPFGFLVESPLFIAFLANSWGGHEYSASTLFTLRSQDDEPLERSKRVRIYHGFGDAALVWRGVPHSIKNETVLDFTKT